MSNVIANNELANEYAHDNGGMKFQGLHAAVLHGIAQRDAAFRAYRRGELSAAVI